MADTILTKIALRNDTLANWESSTTQLLKGEVALAMRTDGAYEVRVGTGDKTWSQLSANGQVIVPSKNVENLTYDQYRLSSWVDGSTTKFVLQGKNSKTQAWGNIGTETSVTVDFTEINNKISFLSDTIDDVSSDVDTILTSTLPQLSGNLTGVISTVSGQVETDLATVSADLTGVVSTVSADLTGVVNTVSGQIETDLATVSGQVETDLANVSADLTGVVNTVSGQIETDLATVSGQIETDLATVSADLTGVVNTVSGQIETDLATVSATLTGVVNTVSGQIETDLATVSADTIVSARTFANNALTAANANIATVSAYTQSEIEEIKSSITDAMHFQGKAISVVNGTDDTPGYYTILSGEQETSITPNNGDIVLLGTKEFVWSDLQNKWVELGDEGDLATFGYVDNAKAEAIAATQNTVAVSTDVEIASCASGTNVGDMQIVKNQIGTTGKYEYTAYVWNGTSWEAMDGNYSAENVYFKDDITLAGDYTEVGNVTKSKTATTTLTASGKSVKDLFQSIFTKELNGSVTLPSYTFSATGSQGINEVGTTYTVPTATFTYKTTGSYTYNPTDAACEISAGQVTIARTTSGEETSKTNTASIAKNGTLTCDVGSTGVTLLDYEDRVTYNYTCSAQHTQGVMPKSNIGNEVSANQIQAGAVWQTASGTSNATTASATFYGYRKLWLGAVTDATSTIDETFVKANLTGVKADGAKKYEIGAGSTSKTSGYTHLTLPTGTKRIIVVLPASGNYKRTLSQVLLQSASNTPVTDSYKSQSQIDIGGAVAGANTMKYNVYVYQPDAIGSDEVHDISIG